MTWATRSSDESGLSKPCILLPLEQGALGAVFLPDTYNRNAGTFLDSAKTQVNGVAPDPAGSLVGTDIDGAFTDVVDLSRRLATSEQAKECVAQQMATYAAGRQLGLTGAGSCADREIAKIVDDNGGRASAVFRGVVLNPVFATRVVGGP